jgi:DNA-3-methyladenine glycosylase I
VAPDDALYTRYHDVEWGVPVKEDHALFERITLEGAQAGLSWITVLRKRERYRQVFAGFDPVKVAEFDDAKVAELMADPGIIRNRAKIMATINNAARFRDIQARYGTFSSFLWEFVDGKTVHNSWRSLGELPAETETSRRMSKTLLKAGFKFVGPTICYAMMQACGLVNDHTIDCFRYAELKDG